LTGGQGVVGSNPAIPTNFAFGHWHVSHIFQVTRRRNQRVDDEEGRTTYGRFCSPATPVWFQTICTVPSLSAPPTNAAPALSPLQCARMTSD